MSDGAGYTGFTLRLDNASGVKFGSAENVLAVHVSAEKGTGWWYEGGGIYRPVHLVAAPLLHIEPDGLFVPARVTGAITAKGAKPVDGHTAPAAIDAQASIRNFAATGLEAVAGSQVRFVVTDAAGSAVAHATAAVDTKTGLAKATLTLPISTELWSITRPYLYIVTTTIVARSGADGDSLNTTIGVRSLNWNADTGFFLNREHAKIRGFCDHNDFGGVGMAVPDRIKLFRAQQLRSVGGNGRRMSHNPPQPSMLDIYDRLGVLVMDENRFFDDAAVDVKHMADIVRRDRNHPSVIIWNFCNEGGCSGVKSRSCHTYTADHCMCLDINNKTINQCATGAGFRNASYALDGTRGVMANEEPPLNPLLQPNTDVQGFSHRSGWMFDDFHLNASGVVIKGLGLPNNTKPTVASECCSCTSVRGEGGKPAGCIKGETNISNGRSFVSGTFSWTLNDYYGEARGIGVSYKGGYGVSSEYGQFDLAGFEKGSAWWYRAWWRDAIPIDASDRSISTQTSPVCQIWGDRWDADLVKPKVPPHPHPAPPSPGPGPPSPSRPGAEPGDVLTGHCDGSDVNQHWWVNGSTISWLGGSNKCLAYSTKRAAVDGHGQAIVVASCDGSAAQTWNFTVGADIRAPTPVPCIKYSGQCQCIAIDNGGAAELFHCADSGQPGAKSGQVFGRTCWAGQCHVEGIQVVDTDPEGKTTTICLSVVPPKREPEVAAVVVPAGADPEAPQTAVEVVTAANNVELLVDGVAVSAQQVMELGTAGFKVGFVNGSNLTALCRNAANETVATHSLVAPGAPAALRLSIDAPSIAKGTGSALLLDGHDSALLRAELVDSRGNFVGANLSINVSFAVSTGPGRVLASHNGDPSCHTPNLAHWHHTFHGLVRGIVQVTHDASSPANHRHRLRQIDLEGGRRTTIVVPGEESEVASEIVVTASSPGLRSASVSIPVSTDVAAHSVLASAAHSLESMQW